LDINDDGVIKKEEIQGVFEHLEIPLDEELHLLIKSYTSPTITYEDFIDQYHEYLFGTQATQHNVKTIFFDYFYLFDSFTKKTLKSFQKKKM